MAPQVMASSAKPAEIACDALIVGATKDGDGFSLSSGGRGVDEALGGYLTEHLGSIGFKAKANEIELVATGRRLPAQTVAVVGLGETRSLDPSVLGAAAGAVARRLSERPAIA